MAGAHVGHRYRFPVSIRPTTLSPAHRLVSSRARAPVLLIFKNQSKGRSRHMDEWDVETVVAWFHSVGYTQHDAGLREHQAS